MTTVKILEIQKLTLEGEPKTYINTLITLDGETIFHRVTAPDFDVENYTIEQVLEIVKEHSDKDEIMSNFKRMKQEKSKTYKHDGQSFKKEVIIKEWGVGETFAKDDIVEFNDKLFRAVQPHTVEALDWNPEVTAALWSPILVFADEYMAWKQPLGAHDAYPIDSIVSHNDGLWISLIADNVWEPSEASNEWKLYQEDEEGEEPTNPEEPEYPAWEPWDGNNENLYSIGDRVTHNGKNWESDVDNNHWEPPTQWSEINN